MRHVLAVIALLLLPVSAFGASGAENDTVQGIKLGSGENLLFDVPIHVTVSKKFSQDNVDYIKHWFRNFNTIADRAGYEIRSEAGDLSIDGVFELPILQIERIDRAITSYAEAERYILAKSVTLSHRIREFIRNKRAESGLAIVTEIAVAEVDDLTKRLKCEMDVIVLADGHKLTDFNNSGLAARLSFDDRFSVFDFNVCLLVSSSLLLGVQIMEDDILWEYQHDAGRAGDPNSIASERIRRALKRNARLLAK